MTYKSALAETGFGGGKAVIFASNSKMKSEKLLLAFGEVVNHLEGRYIAAEDVGSSVHDLLVISRKTPFVAALPTGKSSGDPARFTAWGVFKGMKAVAKTLWGTESLSGKRIAIQGLGHVGSHLARHLFWEGADLVFTDLDPQQMSDLGRIYEAEIVSPDKIYSVECDIFSPCAMGGSLNDETIPKLRCAAVAGSANNQLFEPHYGEELMDRGILYAPDFVINAGGIINAAGEFDEEGYSPKNALRRTNKIFDTLMSIFDTAQKEGKSTVDVALDLAEYKLSRGIGKRRKAIKFK
jgi:leucine dehydrogenase